MRKFANIASITTWSWSPMVTPLDFDADQVRSRPSLSPVSLRERECEPKEVKDRQWDFPDSPSSNLEEALLQLCILQER